MAKRTVDERIAALDEQAEVIKARKQKLLAQKKEQDRKARTHRLIETGAIVEKALGMEFNTPEMRQRLLDVLLQEVVDRNGNKTSLAQFIRSKLKA